MQINNVSPPPIDNDPPPSTDEGKKKLQQFISMNTWGAFKTWLSLQITAAINQILQILQNFSNANGTVTINENVNISGSLNGLPSTPGMAQLMGSGQHRFINGQSVALIPYNPAPAIITGSYTFGTSQGFYYQVGHLVFIEVVINIATFTTAGVPLFNCPPGLPQGTGTMMPGRESAVAGYMLIAFTFTATTFEVAKYDSTNSVQAAGDQLIVSGCYYTP